MIDLDAILARGGPWQRAERIGGQLLLQGDCREVMAALPSDSVDAIITDPPYGLSFMGNRWDYDVPGVDVWAECLRVLKPGGHLLAFAGTRTQHRMAVRIEDAGFEVRDLIAWVYGSGFPKSLDVSKAIDKAAGAEREVVGVKRASIQRPSTLDDGRGAFGSYPEETKQVPITAPATSEAERWQGWGTALKPALEPITVARKPLAGTVAANVLEWGTGAINVDGARVNPGEDVPGGGGLKGGASSRHEGWQRAAHLTNAATQPHTLGRWPANLIHDGSDEVTGLFPVTTSGAKMPHHARTTSKTKTVFGARAAPPASFPGDTGSAARFFYCAKASKRDRDEGNIHPTVKPTDLMRYLCRLVTPPGGIVLDPFMGSGSTGKAADLEGFGLIGIERKAEYFDIACARVAHAASTPRQEALL
jgi:DNA modification methylase